MNSSFRNIKNPRFDSVKLTLRILTSRYTGLIGLVIILVYFSIALIVEFTPSLIGLTDPNIMVPNFANPYPLPPSSIFPLGTTYPGINLLSASLKAVRIDVYASLLVIISSAAIGSFLGVIAGYSRGLFDTVIMRVTDVFFSIPFLVLALAVGFAIGRTLNDILLALIIVHWPIFARLTRSQTLSLREENFVIYSKLAGNGPVKTVLKHLLPNTFTPVLVQISLSVASVVIILASLYFIGFASTNPYLPELGALISIGFPYALSSPWVVVVPGLFLMVYALGMNMLGDGLRDALDPKNRT